MNVLLISVQNNLDALGTKYLHYYLLNHGYNSTILFLTDFNSEDKNTLETIRNFVNDREPGFIGISMMSLEYYKSRDITMYLKENGCEIPVVWGGIHPSIDPEMCLKYADYVCIGEGEKTIVDIADAVKNKKTLNTINNLCYTDNGTLRRNPLYPRIADLDEIPYYDHLPVNSYIYDNDTISQLDRKLFKRHARYLGTTYTIISSRGCPFSCTFCCNNFLSRLYDSKKIRRRSKENILAELEKAKQDHPELEYVNFLDDCFLAANRTYLEELAELYKEKIGLPFIARGIPIFIKHDQLNYLKDAGLAWLSLGLQSGSDRICTEIYKRKSLKKDFLRAAKIVNDLDIAVFYDVITDNPFETEEDALDTIETLIETPKPIK